MQTITSCLWFNSNGKEAAEHYVSIFPDSSIGDVTFYGPDNPGDMPEGSEMTIAFTLSGQPFTALNGGPQFTFSEAISFEVPCDSQEEVDEYWDKLGAGGEYGPCGWLKDKFGVSWQVYPTELMSLVTDPDPLRAQRAIDAMLKQSKIEIDVIRAAADG